MKFLIFFFAVLTVSCADDPASPKAAAVCVPQWKYTAYQDKKSCLKSYMNKVIKASAPDRRKRDAPETTNTSTTVAPLTKTTTLLPPTAVLPPTTVLPPKICSNMDEVKGLLKTRWDDFETRTKRNVTSSNEIRMELIVNILQEKRLKEFKPDDFVCIKNKNKELMDTCVVDKLSTTANMSRIPNRISNVLSKPSNILVSETSCKNHGEVSKCVKGVVKACSATVQKFIEDLDKMMSNRCDSLLKPKVEEPKMTTTIIVVIVLVCICGTLAAGFGIYKFLKMRRNRGLHTVTRTAPEECEMTSRTRP